PAAQRPPASAGASSEGRLGPPGGAAAGGMPLWPEPSSDAAALQHQGETRPKQKTMDEVTEKDRVYAEDWWSHARPILELHGYFRVRAQLEHKFSLGRIDPRSQAM
ncbi:MAG TPA: TIGR04551 family protein, partial [Polyangiaceae bacterium]|nr:TIGR04551 family protein [Polyangiaceae bacterium]